MQGKPACAKTASMKQPLIRLLLTAALALPVLPAFAAMSDERNFIVWLDQFRQEADGQGLTGPVVKQALDAAQFLPRVIELDQKQPEGTITFDEYVEKQLVPSRISRGQQLYHQHRQLLQRVAREYGVPAQYIMALWGVETNYGANTGGFDVISSLATLAYEGRRAGYFKGELIQALRILQERHVSLANMKGSWAGAMGQCQFMPTSFWKYAVDDSGDGKRDIWRSLPDVFASTANYLRTEGWNKDIGWGIEVTVPPDLVALGPETEMPYAEWLDLGIKPLRAGAHSPTSRQPDAALSLIRPDGVDGRAFLVTGNYKVIKHWNRSTYFATTIGLLADRIGS